MPFIKLEWEDYYEFVAHLWPHTILYSITLLSMNKKKKKMVSHGGVAYSRYNDCLDYVNI